MRSTSVLLDVLNLLAPRDRDNVLSLGEEPCERDLTRRSAVVRFTDLGEQVDESVEEREVLGFVLRHRKAAVPFWEVGAGSLLSITSVISYQSFSGTWTHESASRQASARG